MNSMRETIGRIIRAGMALGGIGIVPAGCADRPPTGQVLASVDGDDVTKRDLAVEAALTRLPPGPVTLNAIVDRKLLVRRAKRERLEMTPEYLAAVRRFREATLATLAVQQVTGTLPAPGDAAVRAYAAAHDWRFAGRRLVEVEDAGERRIIDTATLVDGGEAQRLLAVGTGTTTMVGGRAVRIIGSRPVDQSPADTLAAAREALVRQQREDVVRRLVAAERASVRVRYQSGFGTGS